MNKKYLIIGIVTLIAVIAVGAFVMMNKNSVQQTTQPSQSDNTAPSLDTTSADSYASSADASSSSFVNDSTPAADQVVPDYK